jgi:hypothetical protein
MVGGLATAPWCARTAAAHGPIQQGCSQGDQLPILGGALSKQGCELFLAVMQSSDFLELGGKLVNADLRLCMQQRMLSRRSALTSSPPSSR